MNNAGAAALTVAALRKSNRITGESEALVQATLSLADAVDDTPEDAQLWGKYLAALKALQELESPSDDDDGFLRPPVGDTPNP